MKSPKEKAGEIIRSLRPHNDGVDIEAKEKNLGYTAWICITEIKESILINHPAVIWYWDEVETEIKRQFPRCFVIK